MGTQTANVISMHEFPPIFGAGPRALSRQRDRRRSTAVPVLPMDGQMGETATSPLPSDGMGGGDGYGSGRERVGVIAFVVVAIAATAAWLVLLGWLVALLVRSIF